MQPAAKYKAHRADYGIEMRVKLPRKRPAKRPAGEPTSRYFAGERRRAEKAEPRSPAIEKEDQSDSSGAGRTRRAHLRTSGPAGSAHNRAIGPVCSRPKTILGEPRLDRDATVRLAIALVRLPWRLATAADARFVVRESNIGRAP